MKVCLSTCPPERADELARILVLERLAACVNILEAVRSHYRWQGEVQCEVEALLVIKTVDSEVERLMTRLADVHPYETPEIVVLPVESAWPPYLAWVTRETGPDSGVS